ncbi:hypothetical protein KNP414_01483 [Paenibacillus mucilaginosus KNP414]|uniref:Uncharacterized protein n=1 Tax=Paenibacillus mucilaginosus (strain KNP414) TaxID=1036673 RepID=F8FMG4_PAEMK|nr:hypothetical protein KNP414_01483 [Paenibacillus mucilaginosus KNP414]
MYQTDFKGLCGGLKDYVNEFNFLLPLSSGNPGAGCAASPRCGKGIVLP